MTNLTCGMCVCPTPIPTSIQNMDFCTTFNSTHSLCNMMGQFPSFSGTLISGIFIGVVGVLFVIIIHKLFFDKERDKK
jgi:hypothetical protein